MEGQGSLRAVDIAEFLALDDVIGLGQKSLAGRVSVTTSNVGQKIRIFKSPVQKSVKYPSGARLVASMTMLISRWSVQLWTARFRRSSQKDSICSRKDP